MRKPEEFLQQGDGLLVVDVQVDFCPGGALPIPDGDKVVPVINVWIEAAFNQEVADLLFTAIGTLRDIPVLKAMVGIGRTIVFRIPRVLRLHADLRIAFQQPVMITKGVRFDQDQLSVFNETGFAEKLRRDGVKRLLVTGLALDVCVLATVLDGVKSGFEVWLLVDGCRPVTEDGGKKALDAMRQAGVRILLRVD